MIRIVYFISILLLTGCSQKTMDRPAFVPPDSNSVNSAITYLALGDSYTIGERVPEQERFPIQLADSLEANGQKVSDVRIIARTGWTTGDLEQGISNATIEGDTFDLVTLLIGVNDQYRGYPIDDYGPAFHGLLNRAIAFAGDRNERVFVLSIPDYGVTPFGQQRPNPVQISAEIDAYNQINREIAELNGVTYINITPISREALNNASLVAGDQLHPSGEMYRRWVEILLPEVTAALR